MVREEEEKRGKYVGEGNFYKFVTVRRQKGERGTAEIHKNKEGSCYNMSAQKVSLLKEV